MLALWFGAGVLASQPSAPPVVDEIARYGGDDAPLAARPVIYLWPEKKAEAIEAIEAVEDETEPTNTAPQSEAVADLREAIEKDATAAIIRATLARAESLLDETERRVADARRAALIEDMRQAAIAAAMAREQMEIEIAVAICLLA